ncbi:MAG: TIGR04282 family arsenosugar biosynthesis glycosyltransferase, partial [Ferruginibacter sp.]
MKSGLIIFIRNPIKGKVKTRLAKTLGDEKALCIYNWLLFHTKQVTQHLSCDKYLYYSDFIQPNDDWKNELYQKKIQQEGDLGKRMSDAFLDLFKQGYQKVVIIGSDCIELNETIISNGFDMLSENDVVIGPSSDGGYYLLGMNAYFADVFFNKQWGTSTVLNDTLQDLMAAGISVQKLQTLNDIDEEKDLP